MVDDVKNKDTSLVGDRFENGVCEFCGKTIFARKVMFHDSEMVFPITCPCVTEKREKEDLERKYRDQKARVIRAYNFSKLNDRLLPCTFENFEETKGNSRTVGLLKKYVRNFDKFYKKGLGVILSGGVGTGKTHLAVAVFKQIVRQNRTSVFITASNLFARMNESLSYSSEETLSSLTDYLVNVEFLVIDDLGAHKQNDTIREYLYRIIDGRYTAMKPTVITTNDNMENIRLSLGERIADRLSGCCVYLEYREKSRREGIKTLSIKETFGDIQSSEIPEEPLTEEAQSFRDFIEMI